MEIIKQHLLTKWQNPQDFRVTTSTRNTFLMWNTYATLPLDNPKDQDRVLRTFQTQLKRLLLPFKEQIHQIKLQKKLQVNDYQWGSETSLNVSIQVSFVANPTGSKAWDQLNRNAAHEGDPKEAVLRSELIRIAKEHPETRPHLMPILVKQAAKAGTVSVFLTILQSKLIRYDQKLNIKQPNSYRLGHFMGGLNKVQAAMAGMDQRDDEEALRKLQKSMGKGFTVDFNGVPDLPPVRAVWKQINVFLESGKFPKLASFNHDKLMEEVERFLYPPWVTGTTWRGDIDHRDPDVQLLTSFYQGDPSDFGIYDLEEVPLALKRAKIKYDKLFEGKKSKLYHILKSHAVAGIGHLSKLPKNALPAGWQGAIKGLELDGLVKFRGGMYYL